MATRTRWSGLRIGTVAATAAVALGVASTLAVAALTGGFGGAPQTAAWAPGTSPIAPEAAGCEAPELPGYTVRVTVADMGAMMGGYPADRGRGGMMGGYPGYAGPGGMMGWQYQNGPRGYGPNGGRSWWPGMGMGRMNMAVTPARVAAGQVSIKIDNIGWRTHELVVLPLAAGQPIGQRPVGPDGKINESGSLGEASRDCGAGAGDGITPGATGWTTITLQPGRYELVCNLPGHYAAGMYAELDVTG